MVTEVKGIEKMSMLGAGRGARECTGREGAEGCADDDDDDDDDVYYSKGRRPREDEEGEESYEKQRQWPGRGG